MFDRFCVEFCETACTTFEELRNSCRQTVPNAPPKGSVRGQESTTSGARGQHGRAAVRFAEPQGLLGVAVFARELTQRSGVLRRLSLCTVTFSDMFSRASMEYHALEEKSRRLECNPSRRGMSWYVYCVLLKCSLMSCFFQISCCTGGEPKRARHLLCDGVRSWMNSNFNEVYVDLPKRPACRQM